MAQTHKGRNSKEKATRYRASVACLLRLLSVESVGLAEYWMKTKALRKRKWPASDGGLPLMYNAANRVEDLSQSSS